MVKYSKIIPNPSKISSDELRFLHSNASTDLKEPNELDSNNIQKAKFKNYMITMPESFGQELDTYLKKNPSEGRRSGFVVRIVGEYIKSKTRMF